MDERRSVMRQARRSLRRRLVHGQLALVAGTGLIAGLSGHRPPNLHDALAHMRALGPGHATRTAAAGSAPSPPLTLETGTVEGRTLEASLFSTSVGERLPYRVYLPPGYDGRPARRYPVLYMLHGLGGDEGQWQRLGLPDVADRLIREGQIPPMIIIMPRGEQAYWMDHAGGGPAWGRYVARDLVQDVDARFRTVADRRYRAIGGLSMGAHGALQLALSHPDEFAVAGAHSLALRTYAEAPPYFGDAAYYAAHDPMSMVRDHPDAARGLLLWVDIGTADGWRERDEAFHGELEAAGIEHQWHEWAGGHDDAYWSAHVEDYLRFYGAALLRAEASGGQGPEAVGYP